MIARRQALCLLAVTALAGCGSPAGAPASAGVPVSAAAPAADEFRTALTELQTITYRYAADAQYRNPADPRHRDVSRIHVAGAHDPAAKAFTREYRDGDGAGAEIGKITVLDRVAYTWTGRDRTWNQVNLAVFDPKTFLLAVDPGDPAGLAAFTRSVDRVTRTGRYTFEGTLDLSRAGDDSFLPLGAPGLLTSGDDGASFTAKTDVVGHVTEIVVTLRTQGESLVQTIQLIGHGEPVDITKPKK
ncbi:hypothetical protein GCM10010168_36360 [Actinoplanes ianthinogenes]|uniref:Lipoprotein n=1 Tax=Actinoplanes ianthinogenes TaxID=122358 RepID=A0ABN6CNP7_9ACTN|nr:hypothetical protein [Actinoplanes ianthinogenes]BCJ46842.1 hypothetical protein Aiant_74990 [Actinoplanes ianthinogenes]GGR15144.1 hypothetical protein GCM10010168_36360 [Actinoplanes ianthinogenes]